MDITNFDNNFKPNALENCPFEIEWHAVEEDIFSLHGVYFSNQEGQFRRLPKEVAEATSEGVTWLSKHTAGGRIRFRTDSKVVAIQVVEPYVGVMHHMPMTGQMGFSLYIDEEYEETISPSLVHIQNRKDGEIEFANFHCPLRPKKQGEFYSYDFYFPLYNPVKKLYIGVEKGSKFKTPKKYKYNVPVIFYGSSITQGGCAGHPGNDYQGHISRALDCDYINLGFSGNAMGEPVMAEYIASLDHSVFVMDYDHNAPTPEFLEKTHYNFYKTYRNLRKDTPIIFVTKPNWWVNGETPARTATVLATYNRALQEGDDKVYFVDGKSFFGKDLYSCTVDSCHPNDLGFWKMANKLTPVIKKALKGEK